MTMATATENAPLIANNNFDDEIYLHQVRSGLRNGSSRRNVRRNLFGTTTADEKHRVDEWLREKMVEIEIINEQKANFWGFDFHRGVPISSSLSDFQWLPCRKSDVPEFYCGDGNRCDAEMDSIRCQSNIAQVSSSDNNAKYEETVTIIGDSTVSNPCSSMCPDLLKNLSISTVDGQPELTPLKPSEVSQTVFGAPPVRRKEQTKLTSMQLTTVAIARKLFYKFARKGHF